MEVTHISKDLRINEEIKLKEVRLIGHDAEQIGVVTITDALDRAIKAGFDLVEISPNAKPPVCKILDYGKYRFEQNKREKEAKKNQRVINVKEVKIRPSIEEHDFQTKTKNAERFLNDGDKVKVTVMFRGRELSHPQIGEQLSLKMAAQLNDISSVERIPKLEGRNMIMVLTPKQS